METKKQATKKLMIGVGLIIFSLVMGKIVLIPIIIFPRSYSWRIGAIISYIVSWIPLIIGIWLAGVEGYHLATQKYREYNRRTLSKVREHSRRAAKGTMNAIRKGAEIPLRAGRSARNRNIKKHRK